MSNYTIRWYEPSDRDELLALHDQVFGDGRGPEWFRWKFTDNPYLSHVPITVAESDGTLVGARPCLAMRMQVGSESGVALQPCDTMVHPDHRRKGLFTRMTELAIERYEEGEPLFFFNFPNHRSIGGYLNMGWNRVGAYPSSYRIRRPSAVATTESSHHGVAVAGRLAGPLVRGYNRLTRLTAEVPSSVAVERDVAIPATRLAAIAERTDPAGVHANRDESFYRWRFDRPDWEYTTYIAVEAGGPPAAVIAGSPVDRNRAVVRLTEVLPLTGPSEATTSALIDRVLTDHPNTDLFVAPTPRLPESTLSDFGFHADTNLALSGVTTTTNHVVRPLHSRGFDGVDLSNPEDWAMTFAEHDTS